MNPLLLPSSARKPSASITITITGLDTFTCVAVWLLPFSGFIGLVALTNALWVAGCWLGFTCVGLEPTRNYELSWRTRTKFAILGMLDLCPMSGYDIKKMSAVSISHFWKEDYGHIYPTLKLLLGEGLATKKEEPSGEGKPGRHLYSITKKGGEALVAWLPEAPNPPNLRIELLLKVFFGTRAKKEDIAAMLASQEAACRAAYGELLIAEKHLQGEIEGGGERGRMARFQLMTLRYGKRYYESLGDWCRESLEELGAAD